jgi:hypothetical protein
LPANDLHTRTGRTCQLTSSHLVKMGNLDAARKRQNSTKMPEPPSKVSFNNDRHSRSPPSFHQNVPRETLSSFPSLLSFSSFAAGNVPRGTLRSHESCRFPANLGLFPAVII